MYPPQQPPAPPQKQGRGLWLLWGCLGCGGLLAALVVVAVVLGALRSVGESVGEDRPGGGDVVAFPTLEGYSPEPAEPLDVELTAEAAEFTPNALYTEGDYTSVLVTVVNNGDEAVDVNPFYFTITDTDGAEHGAGEGMVVDDTKIPSDTLAPGESATGTVTASGAFEAASVEFSEILGGSVTAEVR
ncbi:DUF4352 domain-containing protein [Actinorugispora endophytica]|uniref:Uncharacterized protein DUF4352 n=1 Tax=Actinorugispora endophytica TaxID=1605990 RepID=A0A4R6V3P7_9ACTN|nr:DUF4352 domain-containing protein [Actinorugispora endophytica]TDQ53338.1 uncharacterized protein DUF4352 [Actinorugispora endophytica]